MPATPFFKEFFAFGALFSSIMQTKLICPLANISAAAATYKHILLKWYEYTRRLILFIRTVVSPLRENV